jgi:hypothetical protein
MSVYRNRNARQNLNTDSQKTRRKYGKAQIFWGDTKLHL